VRHVTGAPIKFVGVSEKLDGLELFHPDRMAARILGMGDVLSLVEQAQKSVDVKEAERLTKKLKAGKGFDLEDFKDQIAQMRKMGGLSSLVDKLPAQLAQAAQQGQMDEKQIGRSRTSSRPRASAASRPAPGFRCRKSTGCSASSSRCRR
jgi:signal recognition particle subunit SRP54